MTIRQIYTYFKHYGIATEVNTQFTHARKNSSPLVLDLDGDGIEITPLSGAITFDHDADGIRTGTAWVGADDGLLVHDIDGNGVIDSGRELLGDNTLLADGRKATDGYAALGALDTNADGVIDTQDAGFASLRVWRDLDQDGVDPKLFNLRRQGWPLLSPQQHSTAQLADHFTGQGACSRNAIDLATGRFW